MTSIELSAPAKINLFLKVLGKRKDSRHNILTLFERISLSDTVKATKIPRGVIVRTDKPVTSRMEDNIAYKAANLILSRYKVAGGVRIHIQKKIPVAAGLGGGSSDAAAALSGINKLYDLRLKKNELMTLGARVGADVPFFLFDKPFAVGTGKGDKLKEVRVGYKVWHLLVYPGPFKASTKDIYRRFDSLPRYLTSPSGGAKIRLPKDLKGLEALLYNDLGEALVRQRPVIGKIIECLASSLGKRTIVSGSGPSLFCLYRTRKEVLGARGRLFKSVPAADRKLWRVFIVETKV